MGFTARVSTVLHFKSLSAIAFIVSLFVSAEITLAQVALQQGGSKVTLTSGAKGLVQNQAEFLQEWRKVDDAPSAVVRLGDKVAVIVRSHSERDLDRIIQGNCKFLMSLKDAAGEKCILVGKKTVKTRNPKSGGISLSQWMSQYYVEKYQPSQKPGKFGALAIRPDGGWGASWGWNRENGAKRKALRECKDSAQLTPGTTVKLGKIIRTAVAKDLKLKCAIVHVHRP